MSTRALIERFYDWSEACDALVLMTVIETQGSTYSKTGTQLLMRADGRHAGLVSGGCLEGDLAEHANQVMQSGKATVVTYDMRDDADDLWGIGLGCNGLMRLLLQRITANDNWQPFTDIAAALADTQPHTIRLVTEIAARDGDALTLGQCTIDADIPLSVAWQTRPWTRLLVLGAAPDAEPVVRLARELGWMVTVADHRPQYLDTNDFTTADKCVHVNPAALSEALNLNAFDAIVIMSHHLETDRHYLQEAQNSAAAYLGVLGPNARKQKLLDDIDVLEVHRAALAERLHGPVGLPMGADSPETIALSLLSEIQSVLSKTNPQPE